MRAVTRGFLYKRSLATCRIAEFGFLGFITQTRMTIPLACGQALRRGVRERRLSHACGRRILVLPEGPSCAYGGEGRVGGEDGLSVDECRELSYDDAGVLAVRRRTQV